MLTSIGNCRVLFRDIQQLFKTVGNIEASGRLLKVFSKPFELQNYIIVAENNIRHDYSTKSNKIGTKGIIDNFVNGSEKLSCETQKDSEENILTNYPQQIKSLCSIFKCKNKKACELILKFPFLKKVDMSKLQLKCAILIESEIPREELMNDMWILLYSTDRLKERLQIVKNMHCSPIKPWHLRCSKDVLSRLSINKENNRLAMSPYQSLTDYISKRLRLSEDQVQSFARKHPPVMRVKVAKLKEVIDFLFSEGFNANQIYNTPRILCHSLKTTQRRLAVLRAHNHEPYSLFVLCKSRHKFNDYVRNLLKSSK